MGPVRNQGTSGSSILFSELGAVEGLGKIKTGTFQPFSDQQLVDCVFGSSGGMMGEAFKYYATHSNYMFTQVFALLPSTLRPQEMESVRKRRASSGYQATR